MIFSMHNVLKGTVKLAVSEGPLSEVLIELDPGTDIRSAVSTKKLEEMGLKQGKRVVLLIKAIDVSLAVE
jgi:molybdopterin-binding protein